MLPTATARSLPFSFGRVRPDVSYLPRCVVQSRGSIQRWGEGAGHSHSSLYAGLAQKKVHGNIYMQGHPIGCPWLLGHEVSVEQNGLASGLMARGRFRQMGDSGPFVKGKSGGETGYFHESFHRKCPQCPLEGMFWAKLGSRSLFVHRRASLNNVRCQGLGYVDAGSCWEIPLPSGCAPGARSSAGSRRSLSPKALATFNSVARVGLPSSDSAE